MPRIVYKSSNRAMNSDEIDKIVREAYEAADEARRDADKRTEKPRTDFSSFF